MSPIHTHSFTDGRSCHARCRRPFRPVKNKFTHRRHDDSFSGATKCDGDFEVTSAKLVQGLPSWPLLATQERDFHTRHDCSSRSVSTTRSPRHPKLLAIRPSASSEPEKRTSTPVDEHKPRNRFLSWSFCVVLDQLDRTKRQISLQTKRQVVSGCLGSTSLFLCTK